MKAKRFLFVSAVVLISMVCIGIMNVNYDRLSRYPYQDAQARALIDEYFTDEEIAYIIEYSIAPSEFINYISAPDFSVYHASMYNRVRQSIWYLSDHDIVYIVDLAREKMSMDELVDKLLNYDSNTVIRYLTEGDIYYPDSVLVENPGDLGAVVDEEHTLLSRILYGATPVISIPSTGAEPVQAAEEVVSAVKAMCIALESELDNGSTCGGLMADRGYVTYEQQVALYEDGKALYGDAVDDYVDVPGHSEHQLGTALDFALSGVEQKDFMKSAQYEWLKANAHRFGFVETYSVEKDETTMKKGRPWHWRYVGYELAAEMYFNNLTLKEAVNE